MGREHQLMIDEAGVYCRAAVKHIQRGDWLAASVELLAQVRKLDMALQSLTPGGSEYVGDPDRCVAHVKRSRDLARQLYLDAMRPKPKPDQDELPKFLIGKDS